MSLVHPLPVATGEAGQRSTWRRLLYYDPGRWLYPTVIVLLCALLFHTQLIRHQITTPVDILGFRYPWNQQPEYVQLVRNGINNPIENDAADEIVPFYLYTRRELHHGRFPWWSIMSQGGTPFFSWDIPAVLYPFTLLSLLMPLVTALQFLIMITPVVAGIGMYYYLLLIGLRRTAALFGAIAFMFSGLFIAWMNHPQAPTASWLPWSFLCCELIIKSSQSRWRIVSTLALITTVHLFAGHIETSIYILSFTILYAFVRAFTDSMAISLRIALKPASVRLGLVLVGLTLGGICALVQLIPTAHYVLGSWEEMRRSHSTIPHLAITDLAYWLLPFIRGDPAYEKFHLSGLPDYNFAASAGYCGTLTIAVATLAWPSRKSAFSKVTVATIAVLLIALGWTYGIEPVSALQRMPVLGTVITVWLVVVVAFAISTLGAIGVDGLLDRCSTRRRRGNIISRRFMQLLGLVNICLVSAFALLAAVSSKDDVIALMKRLNNTATAVDFNMWRNTWATYTILLLLASVVTIRLIQSGFLGYRTASYSIVVLLIGDMFVFSARFPASVSAKLLYPPAPLIDTIHSFGTDARIAMPPEVVHAGYLDPYIIRNMSSQPDYTFLSRSHNLMEAIDRFGPDPNGAFILATNEAPDRLLLAVANVSLFLSPLGETELAGSGDRLVMQQEDPADQVWVEFAPGDRLTQQIVANGSQLSNVAVFAAASGGQAAAELEVQLADASTGTALVTTTATVPLATAGSWMFAHFQPVPVQVGQRLRITVSRRPEDGSGNHVRLLTTSRPLPGGGKLQYNDAPGQAALRLRLYAPATADLLSPVSRDNVTTLYLVQGARPRVYVADSVIATQGDAATLAALDQLHVPGADAVVESRTPIASGGGQATITRDVPGDVTVHVNAPAPGVLVLNEGYGDGGWQVTVDGKAAHDLRANYLYQGVQVGAGQHVVHFRYRPPTWTISVLISLAGGVIILLMLCWPMLTRGFRRFRPSEKAIV